MWLSLNSLDNIENRNELWQYTKSKHLDILHWQAGYSLFVVAAAACESNQIKLWFQVSFVNIKHYQAYNSLINSIADIHKASELNLIVP